ncbi:MAG: hypothetical protein AAB897_03160, partial [Patescibacteria group bacterium]
MEGINDEIPFVSEKEQLCLAAQVSPCLPVGALKSHGIFGSIIDVRLGQVVYYMSPPLDVLQALGV